MFSSEFMQIPWIEANYNHYFGKEITLLLLLLLFTTKKSKLVECCTRHVILECHLVTIPRCCKYIYVNSFFPCTARLWNYLSTECFPLIYYLSCFKSRINRHLLNVDSFWRDFIYALILLYFLPCSDCSVAVEWISIKQYWTICLS